MSPEECVRRVAGPIGKLGQGFMFDAATFARGAELGLDPWAFYHVGRGGVLGNPDPSVVVATFGFFPPELQTRAWAKGVAALEPARAAQEYAGCCAAYGRTAFAVEGADRLADLLMAAMDAVDVAGLPLFAGWRALVHAGPSEGPARLALALMAAREHRGGCHLLAVRAAGVAPLQAVLSGPHGGEQTAAFLGWPEPWPAPEAQEAMVAVEATTDALVQPAFAVLSAQERAELVTGLRAL